MGKPTQLSLTARAITFFLFLIAAFSWLTSCEKKNYPPHQSPNQLEKIKHSGILNVTTRIDPTTFYYGPKGLTGLEFDLVNLFAKQLGVKVKFHTPRAFADILKRVEEGKTDIAAAGLTITQARLETMRFAPPYQEITEKVIYRSGTKRPRKITHLSEGIFEVVRSSSHVGSLNKLQQTEPALNWLVNKKLDSFGLIYLVNKGLIDYTVADSNQIALVGRFYPKLHTGINISKPRKLAWALPRSNDISLFNEVNSFFKKIKKDKTLAQLIERYYGHTSSLNYVDGCKFREHTKSRLPALQDFFFKASKTHELDWKLLAAIGYQESHWLINAVSPTGVEGLMMLTRNTAKQMGIKDRTDPAASILGGTKYFQRIIKKIPERIPEPDRTWMALASYNIGFGHLEDARILTQKRGGNPDRWAEVKKSLPLLKKKKWYKKTKFGYARGDEPVTYVENIRSYYDLLVWLTEENQIEKTVMFVDKQNKVSVNKAISIKALAL